MTLTAAEIFRNFVTDGVPSSGINQPSKYELRAWGGMLEALLKSGVAGLAYNNLTSLNADLNHAANSLATVYDDPTAANNGMYVKSGASGSGSWARIGDLLTDIIKLSVTGGTANDIIATAPETPTTPGNKLYLLTPTANNTGAATIVVNGVGPVPIKNAFNGTLASGALLVGNQVLMAYQTDHYQLLISASVDASSILADAQAAATSAASSAAAIVGQPCGRLTLVSGVAVMLTSQAAMTTIYYTPFLSGIVPIYNGTTFVSTAFSEVSQTTTDTTKSPAACVANSNYDLFAWVDPTGSIKRVTRGPPWTNDTTRSAGTDLVLVNGLFLNNASITNGPAAQRGTYVGTIRTNGTSTVDWQFGSIASGGGMATFGVWNAYNRIPVSTMVADSTDSWTYTVANTWRAPNGNATMRVNAVRGLNIDPIEAAYHALSAPGAATLTRHGIGLNSTTAFSGVPSANYVASQLGEAHAFYMGLMGLGFNFVSALERQSTTTSSNYLGDGAAPLEIQTGLQVKLWQ